MPRAARAPAALPRAAPRNARLTCSATNGINPMRPGETSAQAADRRSRESARVEQRTKVVSTRAELDAAFALAPPESLVIVSVSSEQECYLGENPDAWAVAQTDKMAACIRLSDTLTRVVRECDSIQFVSVLGDASDETKALSDELGVKRFPTVQYWKNGNLLWQKVGATDASAGIGEGVLFYGGAGAGGAKVSDYVDEIKNKAELDGFLASCSKPSKGARGVDIAAECDKQLAVLDVSMAKDSPGCLHIFPAVLALAKNTAGAVRWSRLVADEGAGQAALMAELKVTTVPTFVMFADGKEVARYSGTDRAKLMETVLEVQSKFNYKLPPPPPRKRPTTADAKRIAQEARDRERAAGRQSGW